MYSIEIDPKRSHVSFHNSKVNEALPDFFDEEYPLFIKFLETYYDYMDGDAAGSFSRLIRDLFHSRDISSLTSTPDESNEFLDLLFGEITTELSSESFYANPKLMARLIADFYRSKGTQISSEQFFKAFFNEEVEVTYPKKDIFILNDKIGGSLIGPESLHYIQDDKRYQIFSVLLKTGLSFSDYEELYKKMVHPAGFYLAADVSLQGISEIGLGVGLPIDPLAAPEYPMSLVGQTGVSIDPEFTLLTMRETDSDDSEFIISSMKILDQYRDMSIEDLQTIHGTIADWASPASITMADENVFMSDTVYLSDADDAESTNGNSSGGDNTGNGDGDNTGNGDGDNTGGTTQPTATLFPETSNVQNITSNSGPRTITRHSDGNRYRMPDWPYNTAYMPRKVWIGVTYHASGIFDVVVYNRNMNSYLSGTSNPTTPIFSGRWLDRAVASGESYRGEIELVSINGQNVTPRYYTSSGNENSELYNGFAPNADVTVFGGVHNARTRQQIEVVSDSLPARLTVMIDEHSNDSDYLVDSMHLDPLTALSGTVGIKLSVLSTGGTQTVPSGTETIEFDASWTLDGGTADADLSPSSPLVILNSTPVQANDPDPNIAWYAMEVLKPRTYHPGSTGTDEELVVDISSNRDVVFYFNVYGKTDNDMVLTFPTGWNTNTTSLSFGQSYTATLDENLVDNTDVSVTVTSTLSGKTYIRNIPIRVVVGSTN
tara:strand:- start:744 stop:2891 length:2148 start_codon:yes stop_codon:yes gene_type:complete